MAKQVAKNRKREYKEKIERYSLLIESALDDGNTTKTAIGESTGLKLWEINDVFEENKLLHAKFTRYRRTIVDTASDNLEDILKDKTHPQNFQATKYILSTYKNDLDTVLEAKSANDLEVNVRSESKSGGIQIVFGASKPQETEE